MLRWFTILAVVWLAVGFTGALYAEDENAGAGAGVVYQSNDTVQYSLVADELDWAACIKCKSEGGTYIQVEVRDLSIEGDVWRGIVSKGKALATTSNQSPTGEYYPPGIWSEPAARIEKPKAWIYLTTSNDIPAGLPAGMQARITSDGILTCKIKNIVGGPIPE